MNPLSTRTQSESYLFDPRPNYPFLLTAKRYWKPSATHSSHPDALTLICTHGTGFHKELWEPTLEYLWLLDGVKVREIWSIDAPNHGDATIHNEDTLQWGYDSVCELQTFQKCTCRIRRLMHALWHCSRVGRIRARCTCIPGGAWYWRRHWFFQSKSRWCRSLHGCSSSVRIAIHIIISYLPALTRTPRILSTTFQPPIHYTSLQLIEPMLIPKKDVFNDKLIEGALRRRDVWPSKQDAFETLRSRPAFKIWDELALRIFVVSSNSIW